MTDIMDLPDEILLEILSYLNFSEMSVAAVVCRRWSQLLEDENFWRHGLWKKHSMCLIHEQDKIHLIEKLNQIPNIVIFDPKGTSKSLCHLYDSEIIRLARERREKRRKESSISLKERLYKWWSPSAPEPKKPTCNLILTGLGLESVETSRIGRNIIYGRNSTFHSFGMSPSNTPGIGSGVLVKYADHSILNIITLYSNAKSTREKSGISASDKLKQNRLLQVRESKDNQDVSHGNLLKYELVPAVQNICCRTDGIIYVVNSKEEIAEEENIDCIQLHAIARTLANLNMKNIPLLILSCVNTAQTPRFPWTYIAESLKLWDLTETVWQICNTEVDTMNGVPKGFEWLIYKVKQNIHEQTIPQEPVPEDESLN